MEKTKEFLDGHIRRTWKMLQKARREGIKTDALEVMLNSLLDQRLAVASVMKTTPTRQDQEQDSK